MGEFLKVLLIILVSSVKFVAGPTFAYFDENYEFTFLETVLYCVTGGMLGVWIFTFFSLEIQMVISWMRIRLLKLLKGKTLIVRAGHEEDLVHPIATEKKIFSKKSRRFVKIWRRYGMAGVAFITPVIISIPVGTVILNLFEDNKAKIFIYMFFSILFWSVMLTLMFELFHATNMNDLKEKVSG
jgi:hypothetical protein